jgi:5,10-methylenetetrahydromethanopterin reductase
MAGRLADGVILPPGLADVTLRRALDQIAIGAAAADRRVEDVDVVAGAFCQITDDVERDARLVKPLLAAMAKGDSTGVLAATGIELRARERLPAVEPDLPHARDWDAAIDACGWVSDAQALRFVETWCLFGSPESIHARISGAAERFGVRRFLLHAVSSYVLPVDLIEGLSCPPGRPSDQNEHLDSWPADASGTMRR